MAENITGIKIKDLPEATQAQLNDSTNIIAEDATPTTRRTKLSTFMNWIKSKLGEAAVYGVANNLTTVATNFLLDARQGKVLNDKINELNTNKVKTARYTAKSSSVAPLTETSVAITVPAGATEVLGVTAYVYPQSDPNSVPYIIGIDIQNRKIWFRAVGGATQIYNVAYTVFYR